MHLVDDEIVQLLADVVSKNGNLLLNIGPKADGTIPDEAKSILLAIGAWMKLNGEAIYGSRPWQHYGEGPTQVAAGTMQDTKTKPYTPEDFRFTTRDGHLYAIEMEWPANGQVLIHSIAPSMAVRKVTLLATGASVAFKQKADGLHLELPKRPSGLHAYVYRIDTLVAPD